MRSHIAVLAHSPPITRRPHRLLRLWISGLTLLGLGACSWLLLSQTDASVPAQTSALGALTQVGSLPGGGGAAGSVAPTNQAAPTEPVYKLANAATIRRTLSLIENLYLEVETLKPPALFLAGLEGLASAAPDALWVPAHDDVPGALMIGRRVLLLKPESLTTLQELGDSFARVFAFYLQAREIEVEDSQIEYATIKGMLTQLDRPSQLLIDDRLDDFKTRSRGTLSGIGCRMGMRQEEPTVLKVLEGSPSAAVGLHEGDRVVRIDGESTTNMGLSEVVNRLRGSAGTWVSLDARRGEQGELLSFKILRDHIKIENVDAERLPGDIGYVRITNFNDETLSNFRTRLDRIAPSGQGLKGLVIDLRQNGGGSLQQSAYMVDEFIANGTIVRTQGKGGDKVRGLIPQFTAQEPEIMSRVPMAILVDRRTASGAEILAGALKYLDRAILIGERTYGKGSVQKLYPLNDHASLKLTIARYLLPADHYIQNIGIQPDIALVPVVADADRVRFRDVSEREEEEDSDDPLKPHKTTSSVKEEASATVFYLDDQVASKSSEMTAERLMSDFEVRFAAQLLSNVKDSSRPTLLQEGQPYVARIKEEQSAALVTALKQRGIDWTVGQAAPGAQAQVRLAFNPEGQSLHAGDKATVTLSVTNTGTVPFSRLRATSASDDPLLDGLEFLFGRVAPGQTRTWPAAISIPAGAAPGTRGVSFSFTAEGSRPPEPFETSVSILEGPAPSLAIEATYEDRSPTGAPGHNNRVLEPGEQVAVKLWVRNTGPGPSGQLLLSLRNPLRRELELQDARVTLEPIAPGQMQEATLTFTVKSKLADSETEQTRLTLIVLDRTHHIRLSQDLDFGQPWSGRLQIVPPRLQLTSTLPTENLSQKSYTLAGRVTDSRGIREVTFYRGRQKVQRILPGMQAERPVTVLPFRTDISLSHGSNLLEVISEDEAGLVTRQQVWVSVAAK